MIDQEIRNKIEQSILFESKLKKIFIRIGCGIIILSGALIGLLLSENNQKRDLLKIYETKIKLSDTLIGLYAKAHQVDSIKISNTCPVKWEKDKAGKLNLKFN
jgi:uncharacterized protein YfcZ (UPF0381/DUF406 family)